MSSPAEPLFTFTRAEFVAWMIAGIRAEIKEGCAPHLAPEEIAKVRKQEVKERVGRITLEEAAPILGCKAVRYVRPECQRLRIPIRKDPGRKKAAYILIADIEAAQDRRGRFEPTQPSRNGTAIGALKTFKVDPQMTQISADERNGAGAEDGSEPSAKICAIWLAR
jgi:hypothetical protein